MTKQEGFTHIGRTAATAMRASLPEAGSSAGRVVPSHRHRYRARGGMAGQTSANGYGQGGSIASIAARRRATGQYEGRYPTGPNGERLGFRWLRPAAKFHRTATMTRPWPDLSTS